MKLSFLPFFLIVLLSSTTLTAQNTDSTMDSLSYSLGVLIAQNLKNQGFDQVQTADLAKGVADVINGNALQIDEAQASQIVQMYSQQKAQKAMSENIEKGKAFLAENAKKEGVVTLASGLQYQVLTAGEGTTKPTLTSKVTTHYHGMLISGKVFDSSVERGQPASFPVNGVIKGWTEALQLMTVGDKWRLFVPSDLAYGPRGAGGAIGPNETLIFDVELLSID